VIRIASAPVGSLEEALVVEARYALRRHEMELGQLCEERRRVDDSIVPPGCSQVSDLLSAGGIEHERDILDATIGILAAQRQVLANFLALESCRLGEEENAKRFLLMLDDSEQFWPSISFAIGNCALAAHDYNGHGLEAEASVLHWIMNPPSEDVIGRAKGWFELVPVSVRGRAELYITEYALLWHMFTRYEQYTPVLRSRRELEDSIRGRLRKGEEVQDAVLAEWDVELDQAFRKTIEHVQGLDSKSVIEALSDRGVVQAVEVGVSDFREGDDEKMGDDESPEDILIIDRSNESVRGEATLVSELDRDGGGYRAWVEWMVAGMADVSEKRVVVQAAWRIHITKERLMKALHEEMASSLKRFERSLANVPSRGNSDMWSYVAVADDRLRQHSPGVPEFEWINSSPDSLGPEIERRRGEARAMASAEGFKGLRSAGIVFTWRPKGVERSARWLVLDARSARAAMAIAGYDDAKLDRLACRPYGGAPFHSFETCLNAFMAHVYEKWFYYRIGGVVDVLREESVDFVSAFEQWLSETPVARDAIELGGWAREDDESR